MLGSLILYLQGMRRIMFQLSGFYSKPRSIHVHLQIRNLKPLGCKVLRFLRFSTQQLIHQLLYRAILHDQQEELLRDGNLVHLCLVEPSEAQGFAGLAVLGLSSCVVYD